MQSPKDFDLSRRNLLIGAAASAAVIAPAATAKAQSGFHVLSAARRAAYVASGSEDIDLK